MSRRTFAAAALGAAFFALGPANAAEVYSQGFEGGSTAGWTDGGDYGTISAINDGTAAFEGDWHGLVTETPSADGTGGAGPYTFFDGSRDTFPGTYSSEIAVYFDTDWATGSGFDYSLSSYDSSDSHLRDFIFHVTQDTSTGNLLVGGSNNTDFVPKEGLESGNHHVVTSSGWYILQHVFREDGGALAVDLNLLDSSGSTLFTETRTNSSDLIPGVVGGNGYAWFTDVSVDGGLKIDSVSLDVPAAVIPLPASALLLLGGLGGLAAFRRKS